MSWIFVTLALVSGTARAMPGRENHFFGAGAKPALTYVDARAAEDAAQNLGNVSDPAARLALTERLATLENWALGYVSARVAMNDRLAPIQASLDWGSPRQGPEYMKKLGTMTEAAHTKTVDAFLDELLRQCAALPDAAFGDAAARTGVWLINTYLPKACDGNLGTAPTPLS